MKKEYDFSKAVQGKFFRPESKLEMPVYLDRKIKQFLARKLAGKKISMDRAVNMILKKEMEMLEGIGV